MRRKMLATRSHATVYLKLPRIKWGIAGTGGGMGGSGAGAAAAIPDRAPRESRGAEQ